MKRTLLAAVIAVHAVVVVASELRADVSTDWNQTFLQCVRVNGGPPGPISRWGAQMHVSMFDAANSVFKAYEPVVIQVPVTQPTNAKAAIAAAAHRILCNAYPAQKTFLDSAYATSISNIPAGNPRTRGEQLGRQVADAVLAARASDGSSDNTPYVFDPRPGRYEINDPMIFSQPATPNWGKVQPWAMTASTQFRCAPPGRFKNFAQLLSSTLYANQVNEVKALGARTGSTRTTDQTDIAWFWANDVDGTSKPPGQLLQITESVAHEHGLGFYKKTRLFALVSMAMADAGIASWDAKYDTWCDLWRPQSAIRRADEDNNPATITDAAWEPLAPWTPPFPAYVSGHATFAAAHAAVMRNYFITDDMDMDIYTDDPQYTGPEPRHYTAFSQIARENGRSRVYLGVHYQWDSDQGYAIGTLVGNNVFNTKSRPICSADFDKDGVVKAADMYAFTEAFIAGQMTADFDKNGLLSNDDFFAYLDVYANGCPN